MHELRWNPLIRQWIIVAAHRAVRPWRLTDKERVSCPFCPGAPELKDLASWDVVVLPNKYPALVPHPGSPAQYGSPLYVSREARGVSEVIVETPMHEGDFHTLTLSHVSKVMKVFKEEFEKLSRLEYIEYVALFRNKGREIGVSLSHPHSQVYALPFIPPRVASELESFKEYYGKHGRCLICDVVSHEQAVRERTVYENEGFMIILPYYAMWPYELHVYPKKHVKAISELSEEDLKLLADAIRVATATYSRLLKKDAPYIMVMHNHPSKGDYHYHFHIEFYQPYRDPEKLKYAAGIEWGYWVFTYDGVPEERVKELRKACDEILEVIGDTFGKCA
ncbi:galactose-1-phosphate uridylyltransferase [Thermosphaera chiliense]|uniref:galactose-1-phosphate uridylyltransferase n=1 Tax=Thermosphaera chiliense TaxID=3402707 RepID=UPI001D0AEE4F|nr:galactose-1-phosphate uridylyltransferase [Thermosphaera aggregans]